MDHVRDGLLLRRRTGAAVNHPVNSVSATLCQLACMRPTAKNPLIGNHHMVVLTSHWVALSTCKESKFCHIGRICVSSEVLDVIQLENFFCSACAATAYAFRSVLLSTCNSRIKSSQGGGREPHSHKCHSHTCCNLMLSGARWQGF